jgi:hypothetical protein
LLKTKTIVEIIALNLPRVFVPLYGSFPLLEKLNITDNNKEDLYGRDIAILVGSKP